MKDKMYNVLRITKNIIMAGIISLILLSIFLHFYCDSGVHIHSETGATDWRYESGQKVVVLDEGFGHLRMDENGYNNVETCQTEKKDVLLLGSSHMEAVNVKSFESTAYVLNHQISENVYNIGISGHTIYHLVSNIPQAISTYSPSVIILETSTVELDIDDMIKVREGTFPEIKVYDSGMLYYIQKYLPAMKYLLNKLILWKDADSKTTTETNTDYLSLSYSNQLNLFLGKIREDVSDLKVIILYHPKTTIDREGNYIDSTDLSARAAFIDACEANDIIFLDMSGPFEQLYNEKHILAHGFANTAVGYGHLNKYGHALIAQELAKAIQEVEE